VGPSGRIKVTDFGIARINTSTLTQTGMIMGTPSFMAPEQYVGLAVDRRADVFSAGIVLYELLTGVKSFVGATHTVAYKICHEAHRARMVKKSIRANFQIKTTAQTATAANPASSRSTQRRQQRRPVYTTQAPCPTSWQATQSP